MSEPKLLQYRKPTDEDNPSGTRRSLQGLIGFAASIMLAGPGIVLLIVYMYSVELRITIFPGIEELFINAVFPIVLIVLFVLLCVFAVARMRWREFFPGLIAGVIVDIFVICLLVIQSLITR